LLRIDDYNHVIVIEHRAHIYRRREWTTPGRQHQRGQHHQKQGTNVTLGRPDCDLRLCQWDDGARMITPA
jgi:hypothetical protein